MGEETGGYGREEQGGDGSIGHGNAIDQRVATDEGEEKRATRDSHRAKGPIHRHSLRRDRRRSAPSRHSERDWIPRVNRKRRYG